MRGRTYKSEGIVLQRRNYSEADRILTVYSKHYGKLSLIAKGVRKLKSRKRGALEIFSHFKFSAARGKNLDIVTEAELINSFPAIRTNLKKTSVAYYLMEVVNKLTREDEKNERLYSQILTNLRMVEKTKSLRKLREKFIYDCLVLLGFWPKGKPLPNPDKILTDVTERELFSVRVGKKVLS
ncbi:DNA repair protein RecO [Patescibacteria group bacterium]|nr:DNA repair protein RecO [Patescibacteria group bacterium]